MYLSRDEESNQLVALSKSEHAITHEESFWVNRKVRDQHLQKAQKRGSCVSQWVKAQPEGSKFINKNSKIPSQRHTWLFTD